MIGKWLSASEISAFTASDKRVINRRAVNEHWVSRNEKANGGIRRIYQVAALPEDIQTAYAESLKLSLTELQSQLKPASKHEKKVILANHNAHSDYGADAAPLEKASAAKRRTASLRAKVLHAWDNSGLNAERFLFEYNEGRIAQDARADLGGKTLSQSTLYNWLGKYQHYDEAGLAPKYKGRGGNGASLDERTRELVWLYYLHKNKPSISAHRCCAASVKKSILRRANISFTATSNMKYHRRTKIISGGARNTTSTTTRPISTLTIPATTPCSARSTAAKRLTSRPACCAAGSGTGPGSY
jgi:hypothetical protein